MARLATNLLALNRLDPRNPATAEAKDHVARGNVTKRVDLGIPTYFTGQHIDTVAPPNKERTIGKDTFSEPVKDGLKRG